LGVTYRVLFRYGFFFGYVRLGFLLGFFFLPPSGKANNLIKVDAPSCFGAGHLLAALQGACEEPQDYNVTLGNSISTGRRGRPKARDAFGHGGQCGALERQSHRRNRSAA